MRNPFKFSYIAVLLFVVIGSSACFDIEETYSFRSDGSGTAEFKVDLSQMLTLLESFSEGLDSLGDGGSESINEIFEKNESEANLKLIPGITNVKNLNDQDKGIVGYSFAFESIDALNNALVATEGSLDMDQLMGSEEGGSMETMSENRFVQKGKKFTRIYEIDNKEEEDDEETSDEDEEQYEQMAEMMFASHFYTINYEFERDVKKVKKNDNAEIRGRRVSIKTPMNELIKGEAVLGAQIKLK